MTQHLARYQQTLKSPVSCSGIGLHSGKTVHLTIKPAPVDSGLRFIHSLLPGRPSMAAHIDQVVDTQLATTLGNDLFRISTVEHMLAALIGCGVDNADIEVDGPELPIMDGSAAPFVTLLQHTGIRQQPQPRKLLRITNPIHYHDGETRLSVSPHDGLKISGEICFNDMVIDRQRYSFNYSPESFAREVAGARTFGYVEQVEELWANGLALGGSLANVIAIHWNRRSVLNEEGLRYDDEFIRHKILDLMGDLSLLGHRLMAHVTFYKSGHAQHVGLMRAIAASPSCWEMVTFPPIQSLPSTDISKPKEAAGEDLMPLCQHRLASDQITLQ